MASTDDAFFPVPPEPSRVAGRALILAAVSCRALIEDDAHNPKAEELRLNIFDWLERLGLTKDLEPIEAELFTTPLGKLDRKTAITASWVSEGMVVLAWALRCADLPPVHIECAPSDIANGMGFLADWDDTVLKDASLRDAREIESCSGTYLALHWRLRQFRETLVRIDFVKYVSTCDWGPLRLDGLEILDRDLAIEGKPIEKVEQDVLHRTLGITQERHQAFNWLQGFESNYSQVTTDT